MNFKTSFVRQEVLNENGLVGHFSFEIRRSLSPHGFDVWVNTSEVGMSETISIINPLVMVELSRAFLAHVAAQNGRVLS